MTDDNTTAPDSAAHNSAASAADLAPTVRRLFEEAAGHDEFGDDDSFFHIGGDSLSGLRITRELGAELGQRVVMRLLFDHPTVNGLSAAASELVAGPDRASGS